MHTNWYVNEAMSNPGNHAAHPPISSREEWLEARLQLLTEEKAHTRQYDSINAKRRRLPMVKLDKLYTFIGEEGEKTLLDLFEGRTQLIIYHFMFGPDWKSGCPGCTGWVDALGDLSALGERDTSFALVSRAPLPKLLDYKEEKGWHWPWYSSFGSDFNFDFHVSLDVSRGPVMFNYKSHEESVQRLNLKDEVEETAGASVFFRIGEEIFHTYSTFGRGGEAICDSYRLLDLTPYGRQEDFEDSPDGWPQKPTYG